jgi:hypothetical protein
VCSPVDSPWNGGPNLAHISPDGSALVETARHAVDPRDSSTWAVEPPILYQDA